jgi:hypothetical protein
VLPPDRGESLCISLWTDRASVRPARQCNVMLEFWADGIFPLMIIIFATWPRYQMASAVLMTFENVFCGEKRTASFGPAAIDLDQHDRLPASLGCK